ncbi:hypothetical protein GCM10011491_33050 [Brucella endophytica]|uniref:Lipoprotein n=1 Tax=Brucella endophytica TaxID=1963359 RepID=A0A916SJB9_9HYPH|nr:hypothetical protein [Brucella endophytica]GGB02289.1 hypothetical protein GCM10011491_33050 [Brucella endophytica]
MSIRTMLFTAAAMALSVPFAHADNNHAGGAIRSMETAKGDILTDAKGMTLYIHAKDGVGKSECYDQCAKDWPPLTAPKGTVSNDDDFTLIERKDGTLQWAHNGRPLYLYIKDKKAGETTGDGVHGGQWHIAKE